MSPIAARSEANRAELLVAITMQPFSARSNRDPTRSRRPSSYPRRSPKVSFDEWPGDELTPAAKFSVAVRGYTVDDADMLCLDLFVDFVSNS